jgi:glycosyltransferase involved in cell wall biosynthesis
VPRVLLAFEPPDGGVAENVGQLALRLAAHGWTAEVAGPAAATPYRALEEAGIPIHRVSLDRAYGEVIKEGRALAQLRSLITAGSFDLLHAHASKAGLLGRLAARSLGVPSLYSPHCFAFATDLPPLWRFAAKAAERTLGHLGDGLLCVCEDERDLAVEQRIARPSDVHVVYNGCDTPGRVDAEPELLRLRQSGPLVGAVATLRAQKRLDVLIDAAPLIFAQVPRANIAIVGNGPLEGALREHAARAGLDQDERFLMLPFRPPAARALAALDLYVLPSAWEAFPIGILEALASGVPQIVTDVGGSREAVGPETGLLVPPGDPVALAHAIVTLLLDPRLREAAAAASRKRHAERFGLERMVAETAAVYDGLLAVRAASSA